MNDSPDQHDGRALWPIWMIPAAVASVLGVAGATIVRTRRQHAGPEPAIAPPPRAAEVHPAPPLATLAGTPPASDDPSAW
jgi:hypothetical protein